MCFCAEKCVFLRGKTEQLIKLQYLTPQVNGRDFSRAEHEEAVVEAIRRDPIVVQVLRGTPNRAGSALSHSHSGSPQDVCVVDVCTQTDITFEHIMALAKLQPSTPPVPDICPFLLSDRWASVGMFLSSTLFFCFTESVKLCSHHPLQRMFKQPLLMKRLCRCAYMLVSSFCVQNSHSHVATDIFRTLKVPTHWSRRLAFKRPISMNGLCRRVTLNSTFRPTQGFMAGCRLYIQNGCSLFTWSWTSWTSWPLNYEKTKLLPMRDPD